MTRTNRTRRTAPMLALSAALVVALAACQSTPEAEPEEVPSSEFSDADTEPAPTVTPTAAAVAGDVSIATIYFDFDKSEIRSDAVSGLRAGAEVLKETGANVVIEGHCDNRGSEEYNLALGERRAAAVRRYLANLGVDMNQMTIISYGEIRPAARGNNETAWARNRRAEFRVVE